MIEKSDASKKRVPYTDDELATIAKYHKNIKDRMTPTLKECRASFLMSRDEKQMQDRVKNFTKADILPPFFLHIVYIFLVGGV